MFLEKENYYLIGEIGVGGVGAFTSEWKELVRNFKADKRWARRYFDERLYRHGYEKTVTNMLEKIENPKAKIPLDDKKGNVDFVDLTAMECTILAEWLRYGHASESLKAKFRHISPTGWYQITKCWAEAMQEVCYSMSNEDAGRFLDLVESECKDILRQRSRSPAREGKLTSLSKKKNRK